MKRIALSLVVVLMVISIVAASSSATGRDDGGAVPIFGIRIYPGYRDWRLISVAHEEGSLNDIRAILGNDIAITLWPVGSQLGIRSSSLVSSRFFQAPSQLCNWTKVLVAPRFWRHVGLGQHHVLAMYPIRTLVLVDTFVQWTRCHASAFMKVLPMEAVVSAGTAAPRFRRTRYEIGVFNEQLRDRTDGL